MFLLLTRILLWVLIGFILWNVLTVLISDKFLGTFGRILVLVFIVWSFLDPTNPLVSVVGQLLIFPLKPLGAALVLLIGAGALRGYGKSKNAVQNQLTAAFLILLLSSVPIISFWLAQQMEAGAIQVEQTLQRVCRDQCPADFVPGEREPAGAIVVLGQPPRSSVPYLTQVQTADTSDRLIYASQLYRDQGNNPFIIVSTDVRRNEPPRPIASPTPGSPVDIPPAIAPATTSANETGIRTLLSNLGVPGDRIFVEPSGPDLYSSAVAINRRLRDLGVTRVFVVSSVLTSRRAALTFDQLGIEATPRFADSFTRQPTPLPRIVDQSQEGACRNVTFQICNLQQLRFIDFIPNADALSLTTRVWEEFLMSIYYFLRGWLSPLGI